jgi:hypothetical protein
VLRDAAMGADSARFNDIDGNGWVLVQVARYAA